MIEQISRIPDPKVRLDRYMELQGGRIVSASDSDLMLLFGWDISAAEDELKKWTERNVKDCDVLGMNPVRVKVYGTIMPDRENRTMFEKKVQARNYARKKAMERRGWDGF
ncbi:MAG: hypothetical protein ACYC9S_08945 [Leptospirales bacterium]